MKEIIWKDIPGYPGFQASSNGMIRETESGEILKQRMAGNGQLQVNKGLVRNCAVQSLVALAFLGPRPKGLGVCHYDGIAANNDVENLYYGSPGEARRRISASLKMTTADAQEARWALGAGFTWWEVSKMLNVRTSQVYDLYRGRPVVCALA